jgi:fructose-1,6-bisphosphatase
MHFPVINRVFLFSKPSGISFFITAQQMKNPNKNNFFSFLESKKQTWKKTCENNLKNGATKITQ